MPLHLRCLGRPYQILTLFSGATYNLSPGCTLNAVYHASTFTTAPLARYMPGECGSVKINWASVSGKVLPLHICAHAKKKRCDGVKPSIFFSSLNCFVLVK